MNVRNGEFEKGREGEKAEHDNGRKREAENCSKEERVFVIVAGNASSSWCCSANSHKKNCSSPGHTHNTHNNIFVEDSLNEFD